MRKEYTGTGKSSPADRMVGWVLDRFWRLLLVVLLSVIAYFFVDGIPIFIEFVQTGGDVPEKFESVPVGSTLFYGKIVAILFINYIILLKRI
ncbi:MAG: hypothetical protein KAG98_05635 [Lentisphaeria bacterium]|nr:hypothetical protein [Lentisphaeria bacterium]